MKELYRTVQTREWAVEFEVERAVKIFPHFGSATNPTPAVHVVRRVLKLKAEHVSIRTPSCGLVLGADVRSGRYLVLDSYPNGDLIDYMIGAKEGEDLVRRLRGGP